MHLTTEENQIPKECHFLGHPVEIGLTPSAPGGGVTGGSTREKDAWSLGYSGCTDCD